jgi:hypothetical protein
MGRKVKRPPPVDVIGNIQRQNDCAVAGQIRMLEDGLRQIGPVRLTKLDNTKLGPFDVWLVEHLVTEQTHLVNIQSLGRLMNEMEVLAWNAK